MLSSFDLSSVLYGLFIIIFCVIKGLKGDLAEYRLFLACTYVPICPYPLLFYLKSSFLLQVINVFLLHFFNALIQSTFHCEETCKVFKETETYCLISYLYMASAWPQFILYHLLKTNYFFFKLSKTIKM